MKLIIDRKKWNGGAEPSVSKLLTDDGRMCCLGFYCLAVGKTEDEILGRTMPNMLMNKKGLELLLDKSGASNDLVLKLSHVNDMDVNVYEGIEPTFNWTLSQREAKITKLFKQMDVEVEFIN